MNKINAIIFSKDRASQLCLLLESIKKNAPDIFTISVLYKASTPAFDEGYNKLIIDQIIPDIIWIQETDFKKHTVFLLHSNEKLSCFFTDDDIIFKPIDLKTIESSMEDEEIFCFSLRLGKNVNKCYTMNCDNVVMPLVEDNKTMVWDWTKHYMDFGYPLSVDGHIFRTKDILQLTKSVNFFNPNTFEGNLQIFDTYPREKMASFIHNVLVNTPNNIVNDTHPNRKGESYGVDAKELNDKFLAGEIIDLDKMDFSNIVGCHQEIEYKYINKDIRYLQNGLFNSIKNV